MTPLAPIRQSSPTWLDTRDFCRRSFDPDHLRLWSAASDATPATVVSLAGLLIETGEVTGDFVPLADLVLSGRHRPEGSGVHRPQRHDRSKRRAHHRPQQLPRRPQLPHVLLCPLRSGQGQQDRFPEALRLNPGQHRPELGCHGLHGGHLQDCQWIAA
jgi:hypothetical protein